MAAAHRHARSGRSAAPAHPAPKCTSRHTSSPWLAVDSERPRTGEVHAVQSTGNGPRFRVSCGHSAGLPVREARCHPTPGRMVCSGLLLARPVPTCFSHSFRRGGDGDMSRAQPFAPDSHAVFLSLAMPSEPGGRCGRCPADPVRLPSGRDARCPGLCRRPRSRRRRLHPHPPLRGSPHARTGRPGRGHEHPFGRARPAHAGQDSARRCVPARGAGRRGRPAGQPCEQRAAQPGLGDEAGDHGSRARCARPHLHLEDARVGGRPGAERGAARQSVRQGLRRSAAGHGTAVDAHAQCAAGRHRDHRRRSGAGQHGLRGAAAGPRQLRRQALQPLQRTPGCAAGELQVGGAELHARSGPAGGPCEHRSAAAGRIGARHGAAHARCLRQHLAIRAGRTAVGPARHHLLGPLRRRLRPPDLGLCLPRAQRVRGACGGWHVDLARRPHPGPGAL